MGISIRTLLVPCLLVLAAGAVALFAMNREVSPVHAASVSDRQLSPAQGKLLELAFRAASALPAAPHVKTRCRLQQDVVDACFALDLPQRALACAEKIDDWRRGTSYAAYAYYCATHGATEEVPHYLELAHQISAQGEPLITQDWQKSRVQVSIARTHAFLGHTSEAAACEAGIERSDMGKVDAVRALRADAGAFDEQLRVLQAVLAGGDFDLSKNALETCAQLFERYYGDPERRARCEETITSSWSRLPLQVRIDILVELTDSAIEHEDPRKALEFVDQARKILEENAWLPENYIPLEARLAALRFRAGAKNEAKLELQSALERYDKQRAGIVDIYRSGALRPVAEAYEALGEHAAALATFKRVVEEGLANPNSRPRAEDLVATCLSLAKCGVEPDAELWEELEMVSAGLKAPW